MGKTKIEVVILKNELADDHLLWIKACEFFSKDISFRVVEFTKNSWLEDIQSKPFDILLTKPSAVTSSFKQLYDERIYILKYVLGYKVFPSAEEVFIYENKRFLAAWLKANKITHPQTHVFYSEVEAKEFIKTTEFPIVAKTNIGASGSGVVILKTKQEVLDYTANVFSGKGAVKRVGPNLSKGGLLKRSLNYVNKPGALVKKFKFYKSVANDVQKDFVIFQKFIPHDFEWRVVRIGDSFFAHKKLKMGEKASGSLLKSYDNPPLAIFDFVKALTDKYDLYSQAVDIFESGDEYFVNEMQCIFGQSDSFQMKVDGIIGRYKYVNNTWQFEPGDFNGNESYNLRVEYIIELFKNEPTIRK